MGSRHLVLSDMHFGTPQSSINDERHRGALVRHVVEGAPWKEVVFTGDLLDANLSTLSHAIEGVKVARGGDENDAKYEIVGFRRFLWELDRESRRRGGGLAEVAERWIYVPGNHDYKIWDLLATRYAFEDVLASGAPLGSVPMPVAEHAWPAGTSFFAGVFKAFGAEARVAVEYPNHLASFAGELMVFTHGHYLDPSQTRGNDLAAALARPDGSARRIVIETAQYQAVASAVSYTRDMQRLIGALFGPGGIADKLRKVVTGVAAWILRLVFGRAGALRGEKLSSRQLASVEAYVMRFCRLPRRPRWFVFGHTHRQGQGRTSGSPPIEVFNAGSCYPDRRCPITFLEVEAAADGEPAVHLMCVDAASAVHPTPAATA